jgi:hypothetical protein
MSRSCTSSPPHVPPWRAAGQLFFFLLPYPAWNRGLQHFVISQEIYLLWDPSVRSRVRWNTHGYYFITSKLFLQRGVARPLPNPQAGEPPLVPYFLFHMFATNLSIRRSSPPSAIWANGRTEHGLRCCLYFEQTQDKRAKMIRKTNKETQRIKKRMHVDRISRREIRVSYTCEI